MEYYPNSNKVVQFTYQLQKTAPKMVQKQFAVNNHTHNNNKINLLVFNVYIHACIISQCYYELIYYYFVLIIIIDWHWFFSHAHMSIHIYICLNVCNCFEDRLPNKHSCLNIYACVIKVQSINQSLSHTHTHTLSHTQTCTHTHARTHTHAQTVYFSPPPLWVMCSD